MHFLIDFLLIRGHFIIVIWQQYLLLSDLRNKDLLTEVPLLAYPNILKNCGFQCNFNIWGWTKKEISVHKNSNPRPLNNRYFCHITIIKWSQINKKNPSERAYFEKFLILDLFPNKFPIVTLKIYHHQKEKSYRGPMEVFGNGMTRGTTWEGVEVT